MDDSLQVEFHPEVRHKWVADDGREFVLPAAIEWVSEQELWEQLYSKPDGALNAGQCAALWQWIGRTDQVPTRLAMFVNRADVMRIWPPKSEASPRKKPARRHKGKR